MTNRAITIAGTMRIVQNKTMDDPTYAIDTATVDTINAILNLLSGGNTLPFSNRDTAVTIVIITSSTDPSAKTNDVLAIRDERSIDSKKSTKTAAAVKIAPNCQIARCNERVSIEKLEGMVFIVLNRVNLQKRMNNTPDHPQIPIIPSAGSSTLHHIPSWQQKLADAPGVPVEYWHLPEDQLLSLFAHKQ